MDDVGPKLLALGNDKDHKISVNQDHTHRLEFVWDKVILALMLLAAALGAVTRIEELLSETVLRCYVKDNVDRDQAAYINKFCYESLPATVYFPFFVLIRGLLVIAIHYLWVWVCEADFRFFFAAVNKLDQFRNPETGEFDDNSVRLVQKVERFAHSHWRLIFYFFKLLIQFVVLAGSSILGWTVLHVYDFRASVYRFKCPRDNSTDNWPLPTQVDCVYNSSLTTPFNESLDTAIVLLAISFMLWGFRKIFCEQHPDKVGAIIAAKFAFDSPLLPEHYIPPTIKNFCCSICCCGNKQDTSQQDPSLLRQGTLSEMILLLLKKLPYCRCCTSPWIRNDLDFLIMILFQSNTGQGRLFRDIQIQKELDKLTKRHTIHLQKEIPEGSTDTQCQIYMYDEVIEHFNKRNIKPLKERLLVVTIAHRSTRCAYMLYSAFKRGTPSRHIDVVAITFDHYLHGKAKVRPVSKTSITVIHVPADIYTQTEDEVKDFEHDVISAINAKKQDRENKISSFPDEANKQLIRLYIVGPSQNQNEAETILKLFQYIEQEEPQKKGGTGLVRLKPTKVGGWKVKFEQTQCQLKQREAAPVPDPLPAPVLDPILDSVPAPVPVKCKCGAIKLELTISEQPRREPNNTPPQSDETRKFSSFFVE